MYKIFTRDNGQEEEISFPEDHIFDILIKEFNFDNDIEINLCSFGNLGNELFLDPRLDAKLENENKDRLNKLVAGKTYKDLNLCYVCVLNSKTFTIKSLLHELNHFNDKFICSSDYMTPIEDGVFYIETSGYITNLICTHLNDFFAEYNSIKRLIDLKYEDRFTRIDLLSIIDISLSYLKNSERYAKEMILNAIEGDASDFDKKITYIYSINHAIIKQLLYFLASYRAFHEKDFSNHLYETHYCEFISEEVRPVLARVLDDIKIKILNTNLNLIDDLKEYLNDKVSEFYENNINEYLSELIEEKPVSPPLYNLQNIMSTINMGWMNHIQTFLDSIKGSWINQLQAIIEPISRMSNFFRLFPNFELHNQEDSDDIDDRI